MLGNKIEGRATMRGLRMSTVSLHVFSRYRHWVGGYGLGFGAILFVGFAESG